MTDMMVHRRYLLVDDDPIFLAVAESVVDSLGAETVLTAADGAAGLEELARARGEIDIIILDLNMPKLDGLAFLRGAAQLGFKGGVVLSSGEVEAILRSARHLGEMLGITILGALKKPLSISSLAALVETYEATRPSLIDKPSKRALPEDEALDLVPYYQAKHDASDGSIQGIECLIRVRGKDGQIHGPSRVFDLIDGHEQLVSTTLLIAAKVLDDVAIWNGEGIFPQVSINIDAKLAEDPLVGTALAELTRVRGIDPDMICLELTETALPNDMSRLVEGLTRLRMAGFRISLDDFGTGASNFEVLRLCPFSEIKLDGSIIRLAETEAIARHFLTSTVAIARELGLEVVGEGVETDGQLQLARRCGIGAIQGFLFSVPVPAETMRRSLMTSGRQRRIS